MKLIRKNIYILTVAIQFDFAFTSTVFNVDGKRSKYLPVAKKIIKFVQVYKMYVNNKIHDCLRYIFCRIRHWYHHLRTLISLYINIYLSGERRKLSYYYIVYLTFIDVKYLYYFRPIDAYDCFIDNWIYARFSYQYIYDRVHNITVKNPPWRCCDLSWIFIQALPWVPRIWLGVYFKNQSKRIFIHLLGHFGAV